MWVSNLIISHIFSLAENCIGSSPMPLAGMNGLFWRFTITTESMTFILFMHDFFLSIFISADFILRRLLNHRIFAHRSAIGNESFYSIHRGVYTFNIGCRWIWIVFGRVLQSNCTHTLLTFKNPIYSFEIFIVFYLSMFRFYFTHRTAHFLLLW